MSGWDSRPRRVLGVYVSYGEVFLTEIERTEESSRFRVRQARSEKIKASAPLWDDAAALSGELARLCMTYGMPYDKISVCLPRELFFVYEKEFPPMDQRDMTEAVRWDIETNVPFPEGTYWTAFGRRDDRMELAAVSSDYGCGLVEAMTDAGLGVERLAMEPLRFTCRREGMRIAWRDAVMDLSAPAAREPWGAEMGLALYAALRVYYPHIGLEFLPKGETAQTARRWQTAGNVVIAGALLAFFLLLARNFWLLSAAEDRLESLRQEYAMASRDREAMGRLYNGKAEIASGEQMLRQLSEERLSWYAVFSVLGSADVDGVYLTEFDVQEDGALLCSGRAMDYAHLVAYMEHIGQEEAFREKPLLKEIASEERDEIRFKLRLRF